MSQSPDQKTNVSTTAQYPPSKTEIDLDRCHLQNVIMLATGDISRRLYEALADDKDQSVAYLFKSGDVVGAVSESCSDFLSP